MGQTAGRAPVVDKTNVDRQRQQEMSRREYQLRNLGVDHTEPLDDKQKKVLMAQVEEDFNRILLLHNQIVRGITSGTPLDYSFLFDASGEIKKRASRLQTTLLLNQSPEQKEPSDQNNSFDASKLKPELLTLCQQIKSFVTNPIIEKPGTVDADNLAKAKKDLASVIALSGLIRKHADQLRK